MTLNVSQQKKNLSSFPFNGRKKYVTQKCLCENVWLESAVKVNFFNYISVSVYVLYENWLHVEVNHFFFISLCVRFSGATCGLTLVFVFPALIHTHILLNVQVQNECDILDRVLSCLSVADRPYLRCVICFWHVVECFIDRHVSCGCCLCCRADYVGLRALGDPGEQVFSERVEGAPGPQHQRGGVQLHTGGAGRGQSALLPADPHRGAQTDQVHLVTTPADVGYHIVMLLFI